MTNIIMIQLHIGDLTKSTNDMDATEFGAYVRLILEHYNRGVEGIELNDTRLARVAKCEKRTWNKIKPRIIERFKIIEVNGIQRITHNRVIEELQKIHKKSQQNRAKALKKWDKHYAAAEQQQSRSNANQKPLPKTHKPKNKEVWYKKACQHFGDSFCESWLSEGSYDASTCVLSVPKKVIRNKLEGEFKKQLEELVFKTQIDIIFKARNPSND